MVAWTAKFEAEACALVERGVAGDLAAWRELMLRLAPRLEGWARANKTLRRCRLVSPDDARTVMVDVFERLATNDHANLKLFLARAPVAEPEPDLVSELLKLGKLDETDSDAAEPAHDEIRATPLRAWLLRLVDFAARDHVRHRLGWVAAPGQPSKRDLHSDAAPLDEQPERGTRPPMTDRLTVARLVAEVRSHLDSFPLEMRTAVLLWLDDVEPVDIARQLELEDASRARALVRAGQARLRERFRGRSPLLFA